MRLLCLSALPRQKPQEWSHSPPAYCSFAVSPLPLLSTKGCIYPYPLPSGLRQLISVPQTATHCVIIRYVNPMCQRSIQRLPSLSFEINLGFPALHTKKQPWYLSFIYTRLKFECFCVYGTVFLPGVRILEKYNQGGPNNTFQSASSLLLLNANFQDRSSKLLNIFILL